MTAIISPIPLTNRSRKRAFMQQAEKIAPQLQQVIDDFIKMLFLSPKRYSYKEIYEFHLNRWNTTLDHLMKSNELNRVAVDRHFFANEYSPKI